jgi:hypothetical protein
MSARIVPLSRLPVERRRPHSMEPGPHQRTFAGEQDQGRLDTIVGGALWETPPAADDVYPVGSGAVGSFCHRPNSFPWGSLQVANQPMPGTGPGSFASPPSSFTRTAPALMSST